MKDTKAGKRKADTTKSLKPNKKAGKDPNQPKKPASAYFIFLEEFREKYKKENPNVKGVTAIAKACGAKWRAMSEQDKAPYSTKAAQRKAQYDSSLADYHKKKAGGGGGGGASVGNNEGEYSGDEQSEVEEEDE